MTFISKGSAAVWAVLPVLAMGGAATAQTAENSGQTGVVKITTGKRQDTPAQSRYGAPRNPTVGAPVDTDISKPLSLERALQIALQQQETLAIAQTQVEGAQNRLTQARSSYYPQLTPSLQYNSSLFPGSRNSNIGVGGGYSENNTVEIVGARQLIFDTGRREANVGYARRSLFASAYGVGSARQDVVLNVAAGYYNVLRAAELVRVENESVRRAQTTLDSINAQVEVGNAAKSDTFQAQSDLANAQVAVLQAQNNLNVSQANLKNVMGIVSPLPLTLSDGPLPAPSPQPDATSVEEYARQAYSRRPDIKQQQELVNAQGYNVRLAAIDAGLSVQANVTEGYQVAPNSGEDRVFSVGISYPLFDAGATRSALRAQRAQWDQSKRTLDLLEQNVHLNVETALLTREQARRQIAAGQTAVAAAQVNYEAALEKQRNGLVNVLEVINAELQLVTAQVQLVQSNYDFYIADAQLQRAIGANDAAYEPVLAATNKPRK